MSEEVRCDVRAALEIAVNTTGGTEVLQGFPGTLWERILERAR